MRHALPLLGNEHFYFFKKLQCYSFSEIECLVKGFFTYDVQHIYQVNDESFSGIEFYVFLPLF